MENILKPGKEVLIPFSCNVCGCLFELLIQNCYTEVVAVQFDGTPLVRCETTCSNCNVAVVGSYLGYSNSEVFGETPKDDIDLLPCQRVLMDSLHHLGNNAYRIDCAVAGIGITKPTLITEDMAVDMCEVYCRHYGAVTVRKMEGDSCQPDEEMDSEDCLNRKKPEADDKDFVIKHPPYPCQKAFMDSMRTEIVPYGNDRSICIFKWECEIADAHFSTAHGSSFNDEVLKACERSCKYLRTENGND